jgi:hypothetical protein
MGLVKGNGVLTTEGLGAARWGTMELVTARWGSLELMGSDNRGARWGRMGLVGPYIATTRTTTISTM